MKRVQSNKMAELDLFMTEDDEIELVRCVYSEGGWMVPDLHYPTPKTDLISDEASFVRFREARLFFILREDFFLCPLELRQISKQKEEFYYVAQRTGGPTIEFLAGGIVKIDGNEFVRPGHLGYYPTYWNTQTKRNEKPPKSLVQFYGKMASYIRRSYTRIKPGVRTYWIGRHARQAVQAGARLIGLEKFPLPELVQ